MVSMEEWAPLAEEIGDRLEFSRQFFEKYIGLEGEQLEDHLKIAVSLHVFTQTGTGFFPAQVLFLERAQAYQHGKYPCVGWWSFLRCAVAHMSIPGAYEKAIRKVQDGEVAIDMGAGLGQELRRLAFDAGVTHKSATEKFWATDLRPDLWNCGKFMFRDDPDGPQPTPSGRVMAAQMVDGDIFSAETQKRFEPICGKTQVIMAFNFFHLFRLAPQEEIACLMAKLAAPGCIILGFQVGGGQPEEIPTPEGAMYLHTTETWAKMWQDVGERTGTRWKVDSHILRSINYSDKDTAERLAKLLGENAKLLEFAVERIS